MQLSSKEDRPTPSEVYNFRMYLFAFMVCFGGVEFGYDSGFIGVPKHFVLISQLFILMLCDHEGSTIALQSFKKEFGMNSLSTTEANNVSSNIVSVFQGGCFFGALLVLPLSDRYGRRVPLIVSSTIFLIGSFVQTWANGNLNMMYVGRTLNGLGVGSASSIVPMFVAEFSPPAIRGRVVGIFEFMYQMGALVGLVDSVNYTYFVMLTRKFRFWINYGTSLHIPSSSTAQWRIPIAIQIIPGSLLLISMFIVR
jgi:MFS family permease